MTLQQLRYIVEVSKCSTISKAAQSLFLTQPTLSKAIKDLEEELGICILERGSSKTRFTAEGTELLCLAKQLLEQAQHIENRFINKEAEKQRLAISTQHYAFAIKAFIDLVNGDDSADYEYYFRECKTHEIVDDVFNKRSDIGILFMSDSTSRYLTRLLSSKDIEFTPLKNFTPHVYLRKTHPLAECCKVNMQQLQQYPCIAYEQDNNSLNFAEETVTVPNVHRTVYVRDRATTINMLANTDSYNVGTGCIIDGIVDSSITSVPLEGHCERMTVGWIKLKNTDISPIMERYINSIKSAIALSYSGKEKRCTHKHSV
ncbi:MAG: LysR family transcriptional regulator [Oscillospiraceae bacterium]|nr:LysR family transcriptional regulator [Oscillospiraceae bacterium]